MTATLTPSINFSGNAREAMTFYHSVFGGELVFYTFKEFNASPDPSWDDLILHAALTAPNGFVLMAGDGRDPSAKLPGPVDLALNGDDFDTLSEWYRKLSEGGVISQPLEAAPWGDTYGAFTDKFGIVWLVNITGTR